MNPGSPILVWTMGKVGTSTVSRALARGNVTALHIHSIRPNVLAAVGSARRAQGSREGLPYVIDRVVRGSLEARSTGLMHAILRKARSGFRKRSTPHIAASLEALEIIENGSDPVKIISMVRDPIARNISAFFENLELYTGSHDRPLDELTRAFEQQYNHSVPLEWFDRELKNGIGFDVFERSFDQQKRIGRYIEGRYEILIMRSDVDLALQQRAVSEFVESEVELMLENTAETKPYNAVYRRFKDSLSLQPDYIRMMYSSKLAQHFWTSDELAELTRRHLRTTKEPAAS